MRKNLRFARCTSLIFPVIASSLFLCSYAFAQDSVTSELPDAPAYSTSADPQQPQPPATAPSHADPQQKRIFGILPNFRAVSAGTILPPQTVKDKFVTATQDSFDYSSFILAGLVAGEAFVAKDTPEFHQGAVGYGRYYWHSFTDQTSENLFVEFIIPSLTHEDTRYYSLGKGSGGHRAWYALTRIVVTRKDNGGGPTFNTSEIAGAAISSAVSNFYYPTPERSVGNTMQKFGTNVGIDAAAFLFREFYPDIYHHLFHKTINTP